MFRRHSRAYRIILLAVVLFGLASVGYLVYHWRGEAEARANLPAAAEAAYECGRLALQANQAGDAMAAFNEANLLTDKAVVVLDEDKKHANSPGTDQFKEWNARRGKLWWNKSLVFRDKGFPQATLQGKPIAEIVDSV